MIKISIGGGGGTNHNMKKAGKMGGGYCTPSHYSEPYSTENCLVIMNEKDTQSF